MLERLPLSATPELALDVAEELLDNSAFYAAGLIEIEHSAYTPE